jgi:phage terminase small subunit
MKTPREETTKPMAQNDREKLFVIEYLKDFNASAAAVRAGYSERTANVKGSQLLAKVSIKEQVEKAKSKIFSDKESIIRENLEFWREVRTDDMQDLKDRLKASEYLGKFAAMFTERVEHSGNVQIVVDRDDAGLV